METNEELREQIFEIIKNQLKDNDPPETKATFDRLRKQGFDDFQTRQLIGQCIAVLAGAQNRREYLYLSDLTSSRIHHR